ncbi:MAG: hypothetical protein REH83_04860 [Rickettsiella sp.]|nr:hypothetical protein [Rickettsiella sp.]
MLDVDTSLTSLLEHIKQFYLWNKGYVNFRIFSPKKNLAGTLKEALIQQSLVLWQPFEKHIEQHGLNKYSNEVERIPNELILKLIRVFGKKPILTQLTKDFFYQYRDGITCRYGVLHRYLASITPTQKKAILDTIKKYRWPVDINDHEKLTQQESHLLNTYEKKVRTELLELEELSLEHLSQLSWEVIRHEIKQLSYIDEPELAEKTIGHLREVHQQWTTRFKQHIKGGIGQSLFFLPDIIRALNNHAEGLISNVGLLASDTLLNKMSHNLIDKLPLNVKRSNLLKRITPNNPLFKVITLYSIFELQHQLKNQAVDSQTYQTIQHHLLEQYTAVGLIAAELFGFEVAPLWIALMIEQFLYSAIEFRKIYHLHISFFKALMMDLGFYRKEFNQIMNERSLLLQSTQLFLQKNSTMSTFFKWLIIRIPEIPSSKYLNIPDESVPLPLKDYLQKQTANVQSCAEDAQAQTLGYRLTSFYKVEKKYPIGKPAYVCEHQLTQNHWERKIYTTLVKNSTIHFNPVKIIHHEENNIFLENIPEETSLLKLISSVDSPTGIISIHPVLLITGGLSALYENHGNVSQENRRNMYLFFDPREGDLNLAFTWQGLKSLGPTNSTDPFLLVVQVDHKTYEEQLIFEAKTYRLNLKDDSMRLQTHYLINTRINFHITDNTSQSEFSFYPYCHNQAENCRVKTLISSDKAIINVTHVGNEFALLPRAQQIFLKKNKNYFTINLNSNFISNPFILFANQTKLLGAKGLGLEKSVIFAQNTKNLEMEDIKGNFTLLDSFSKLMIEGMIVNENTLFYRRYHLDQSTIYLFSVKDFNIVLATLALDIEKINASLAIVFNYSDAWIRWQHNNSASFILELQGPINTNWGSLRFSKEGCILKILNRENKLLQQQNFYFKSSLLSLNTSLPLTGFYYLQKEYSINSSHYFSYRGLNEDATLAQNFSPPARFIAGKSIFNLFRDKSLHKEIIFEFKSEGAPIFYHFLKNQAKFNGIMYRVYKNRLVAQPINNAMDGRNLLFFQTEEGIQSIPVFLNQSFIKTSAKYNEQHNSLSFDDLKFYYLTKTVFLQFNDTDQYISVNLIQDRLCLPIRQQAYKSTRYSLETNDRATLANQSNSQATRLQTQDVSLSNFSHIENTTVFYAYYAHSNLHVDGRQFIKSKVLTRKKVIKEHWLSQINSFFIGTAFATVSLISGAFFIFKKRFKRPAVPVVSPLAIPLLEVSGASALTEEVNQDNYFASNSNNSYCFKLLRVIENIKDIPTNNNSNYSPSSATYTSNLNTQLVFFNYLSHSIKKNFEKDKSNKLKKERAHITADNFHPCLPAKEENTAISNLNDIKCQAVNKTFRLF